MIPLKDDNPRHYIRFYYVTLALILTNVGVFLWQVSLSDFGQTMAIVTWGATPAVLTGQVDGAAGFPSILTVFTSMFMHGGWMHLIGNMLFLWVLGDNVEDALGHLKFLAFYLICGVVAAAAHVLSGPSMEIPMVGASGAVSGVIGAYLVLHPRSKILAFTILPIPFRVPTWLLLGFWAGLNFLNAAATAGGTDAGGVAWWAHVGGFLAGALLVIPMKRRGLVAFDWADKNNKPSVTRRSRSRIPEVSAIRRR